VKVADRRVAGIGGVPPLPVVVVNMGDEPNKVPVTPIAASNVAAVPVQPMMTYSALAPPATFGRVTVPPLNLPAAGVVNPTVATDCQPGLAANQASKVE